MWKLRLRQVAWLTLRHGSGIRKSINVEITEPSNTNPIAKTSSPRGNLQDMRLGGMVTGKVVRPRGIWI